MQIFNNERTGIEQSTMGKLDEHTVQYTRVRAKICNTEIANIYQAKNELNDQAV